MRTPSIAFGIVCVVALGCDAPGGTKSTGATASASPVQVLADAADVIATIKDPASLEAAKTKLAALKPRFDAVRPLLTTTVYLSGEFPVPGPQAKAQMAKAARENPEFKPYLADAEKLAADPNFKTTYRRYNESLRSAQKVPGAITVISAVVTLQDE
jgi:hypothetical protein